MIRKLPATVFQIAVLASACAETKPNIIVIFTDDHGWADPGANGVLSDIRTPHLERLAANGLRATNGYVTAPQCVPSRAGVLIGRYQPRFGVDGNQDNLKGFDPEKRIAERLKEAGYATGMAGKWHLGPPTKIDNHGFDEATSIALAGQPHDPALDGVNLIPIFGGENKAAPHRTLYWRWSDQAAIREGKWKLLYFDMHPLDQIQLPEVIENDLDDARTPTRQGWHKWVVRNKQREKLMQGYLASISYVDHQLGRLLDALESSPKKETGRLSLTSYDFIKDDASSHAVSDTRYRFIRYKDGFEELYDLEKDPDEFTNIVKNPEMASIKAKLAKGLPNNPAAPCGVPKGSKFNTKKKPPVREKAPRSKFRS